MKRILHVIIGLDVGGAELMLKRLVEQQKKNDSIEIEVVSLTKIGEVGNLIQSLGIVVHSLNMKTFVDFPVVIFKLIKLMRQFRPNVVQTWMYHADLVGGIAAYIYGARNIIWGIRGSEIPQENFSITSLILKACSKLSYFIPTSIVCCANAAKNSHAHKGYDITKMIVVPNGYQFEKFKISTELRLEARLSFGINPEDYVIGVVGRFDPLKDYKNFISAASKLSSFSSKFKFIMIGRGLDESNEDLKGWISNYGLQSNFLLTGERSDIPFCFASMDCFCLSSVKEGFPNVVCEAMAMSLPVVVTNAGDASEIVSNAGIVVPVSDSDHLASALLKVYEMSPENRLSMGQLARKRVEKNYSIEKASSAFLHLYEEVQL